MKIGVLTYHIDINPGATLQCYATCRALKELGYEVCIIDLEHHNGNPYTPKALLSDLLFYDSMRRQRKFIEEYFPVYTRHYNNIEELRLDPPQLDAYCIGSDQVWNLEIAGPNHMAYFLDFGDDHVHRFSYASSIGLSTWPIKNEQENVKIYNCLKGYDGLSVREPTAARILKEKFGLNAQIVCDPVLLHKDYHEIIDNQQNSREIACYLFHRPQELLNNLLEISTEMKSPIRMVTSFMPIKGFRHTKEKDVPSWLRYMTSSVFNVTDSFHGTVISLLYHRPFAVVYQDDGRSSRISDLLQSVGLTDHFFKNVKDFKNSEIWHSTLNWEAVDESLDDYRQKSWNYLKDTMANILQS